MERPSWHQRSRAGTLWWSTMSPSTRLGVWKRRSRLSVQACATCRRILRTLTLIELLFHPLKTWLRKAAERTMEGLHRCVGSYIRALDPAECIAYFRHSGYEPP